MGIAALSSKAANGLQNGYKYNGIAEESSFDLDLYDAYYRTLDPQLGRWWQTDPYDQFASSYLSMGNNPANYVDPYGGFILSHFPIVYHGLWAVVGAGIGAVIGNSAGGTQGAIQGLAIGGSIGLGASFVNWGNVGEWVGGLFQENNYWIIYNGLRVIIYLGHYGNSSKSKEIKNYPGTSGLPGYQNSSKQGQKNVGPVPEGDYSIDLRPIYKKSSNKSKWFYATGRRH